MLKNEILEMLEIFDSFEIPEESQRQILTSGVYFDFTYGDPDPMRENRHLDSYGFAMLLRLSREMGISLDANTLLKEPWNNRYQQLVHYVSDTQQFVKNNRSR